MSTTTARFAGKYGIRREDMTDVERKIRSMIVDYAKNDDRDTLNRGIVLGLEFALREIRDDIGSDGVSSNDALGTGKGEPGCDFRILDASDASKDADYAAYIQAGGWLHIEAWRAYEAERAQLYRISSDDLTDEQWRRIGELDSWLLY